MDVIYDLDLGIAEIPDAVMLENTLQHKHLDDYDAFVDLLEPIIRQGKFVQEKPSIHDIRTNAIEAAEHFYQTQGDKPYAVGLEKNLFELKQSLIKKVEVK